MRAVMYTLTLVEPLLATSLQGDPNSSVSLAYVPGSLLRGALIQHYVHKHKLGDRLLEDEHARRLFFDGTTRYLHAYPLSKQGQQRTLPTPRSLLRRKHDALDAGDPTSSITALDAAYPTCSPKARQVFEQDDVLKQLGSSFCSMPGSTMYVYQPEYSIAIHIQRQPAKGRALRGDGEVFRYEALAAEQQFQGVVLVDTDTDAKLIEEMLKDLETCWLGRSRSAHYGKTQISQVAILDQWREYDPDQESVPALEAHADILHSMTLLSDALLSKSDGQALSVLDSDTLAFYLGLDSKAVKIDDQHSFSTITAQSGFNRQWKMPMQQEYALEAGSIISFRLTESLSDKDIARLESHGIGNRRTEGFGRIAFNWRYSLEIPVRKGTIASQNPDQLQTLKNYSRQLARRMARQLYERRVEQSIIDFVRHNPVSQVPSNSQFGRLRVLVRQALPNADVESVRMRFEQFKEQSRSQYSQARIVNKPFDDWIIQLLSEPDLVWKQFHSFSPQDIAGQEAKRNERRVVLQLLAAVLAAPTRDERIREGQQ